MGFGPFDKAHLGVIGYASVTAAGTIKAGSGLAVQRVTTGIYAVRALVDPAGSPVDPANQVPAFSATDLPQATLNHTAPGMISSYVNQPHEVVVLVLNSAGLASDADFNLVVLRPLINP